jgi:hypothetical protein
MNNMELVLDDQGGVKFLASTPFLALVINSLTPNKMVYVFFNPTLFIRSYFTENKLLTVNINTLLYNLNYGYRIRRIYILNIYLKKNFL